MMADKPFEVKPVGGYIAGRLWLKTLRLQVPPG